MAARLAGLVIAASLCLSACGFQPVYSSQGSGVGQVVVAEIDSRTGYFVRNELMRFSSLEQPSPNAPQLSVTLTPVFRDAAVQVNSFADRTLLEVKANWSLALADGTTLRGEVTADTGFDSRDDAYSGIALQADAEERVAALVARAIWADIRARRAEALSSRGQR